MDKISIDNGEVNNIEKLTQVNSPGVDISMTKQIQADLDATKNSINDKLKEQNNLIVGVMIFVAITFLVSWIMIVNDNLRDKDMYLEYFNLQKDSIQSNYELKVEILEFNHEIEMLKVKNYLK